MSNNELSFATFIPAISEAMEGRQAVVVGGLPTDAILAKRVHFAPNERRIILPKNAAQNISAMRPNGSMRDVDVMAFTSETEATSKLQRQIIDALSPLGRRALTPEVSVSGYSPLATIGKIPWLQFVSQTIRSGEKIVFKLGPVEESMPASDFETPWQLAFDTKDSAPSIPVFAPPIHVGRYETRSVTGIRPKDASKVTGMHIALDLAMLPDDVMLLHKPFEHFATRVKNEIRFAEALRQTDPHIATLSAGKEVLSVLERQRWIVDAVQSGRGPFALVAKRGIAANGENYRSTSI